MNAIYARITESGVRYCQRIPHVSNASASLLAEYAGSLGYKRMLESPCPQEGDWQAVYKEEEDFIRQIWVRVEQ